MKCQCDSIGKLQPGMGSWYNPVTELPFVNHSPGKCKCTNDLKKYLRDGKEVMLCSCCCLSSDKRV